MFFEFGFYHYDGIQEFYFIFLSKDLLTNLLNLSRHKLKTIYIHKQLI
jgi:hypothetical protein